MNSIESLQVLYDNLKSHMTRDNPMFDLEYEQIKRDLKVLEIFKKLDFEIYENGGGENWNWYLDFYHSNKMTEEEIEIIKEWFENE